MTDPRAAAGQIETPNPLELYWEKNKRWVILACAALVIALGANYGLAYLERERVDSEWSRFAAAANLDAGYAEDGTFISFLNNPQFQGQFQGGQMARFYLGQTQTELASQIQTDLLEADGTRLAQEIQDAKGTSAEPLLIWLAAVRAAHGQEWETATGHLNDLQQRFPDHFLCRESEHPTQFQTEVEKDETEDEAEEEKPKKDEKPELEPPVRGSLVSLLADQISREKAFRAANPALYEAVDPPTDSTLVEIQLTGELKIRMRLYTDLATSHCENFLEKIHAGHFHGQRIDQIQRKGTDDTSPREAVQQLHFGLEASKNDDRTTWNDARTKASENQLDFEYNDLSHFPGMVAAAPGEDGQSAGDRIFINANDAVNLDGERVIFARVLEEDLGVIEDICGRTMADVEMGRQGTGQLMENLTIEAILIDGVKVEPPPEEPEPKEEEEQNGDEDGGEKPEEDPEENK